MGELNLTWCTTPPIKVLQPNEVQPRLAAMLKNMQGWDVLEGPSKNPEADLVDEKDFAFPKRTHKERWNQRILATNKMLRGMGGGYLVVEYRIAGEPAGIMTLNNADPTAIAELVTHPGSFQAGGILIEFAVNQSVKWGHAGKLQLTPDDDDALASYEALGFEFTGAMRLDPSQSDKWSFLRNEWKLTKFPETPFFWG